MLKTPFTFEPGLSAEDYQKLGNLSLRWSHTDHVIGNCLRVMLRLTEAEAIAIVFPMNMDQRLQKLNELAPLKNLNDEAKAALRELTKVMQAIRYVRNSVTHAIVTADDEGGHTFELRSKRRKFSKEQIFSTDELTNYAAHVAYSLRYALGLKDKPGARHPIPDRPEIPDFLLEKFPELRAPR